MMRTLTDDEGYRTATEKLRELKNTLSQQEREIDDLHAARNSGDLEAEVATLLGDCAGGAVATIPMTQDERLAKVADIRRKQRAVRVALERQERTLAEIKRSVSLKICEELRREYEDAILAVAIRMIDVAEALDIERGIRTGAEDGGVEFTVTFYEFPTLAGFSVRKQAGGDTLLEIKLAAIMKAYPKLRKKVESHLDAARERQTPPSTGPTIAEASVKADAQARRREQAEAAKEHKRKRESVKASEGAWGVASR